MRWVAAAAAVVAAVSVLLVGRWERGRHADTEAHGMRAVLAALGPLDGPTLSRFRYLPQFQCLTYDRGGDVLALEVCADAQGRVVEAIDRRRSPPRIWSLRDDVSRSSVRIDRAQFDRLLLRLDLPARY